MFRVDFILKLEPAHVSNDCNHLWKYSHNPGVYSVGVGVSDLFDIVSSSHMVFF